MSVFKRGGIYYYEFVFKGQRIKESTRLTNRTAALQAEAIRRAELAEGRAGIQRPRNAPVFEHFLVREFMPWSQNEHKAHPRTYKRYQVSSKPLLRFFGKMSLDEITPVLVENFKIKRLKEVTPTGVNRDLAALRLMLNFSIRQGHVEKNPVSQVRLLQESPGMMRILSHEEERKYLLVAQRTLKDVATIILETGMRPEEVFTMESKNVYLEDRYVYVPKGKTSFARRTIPLTDRAISVLRHRINGHHVFPSRLDSKKHLTTVQKLHEKACRKANLEFRLYDLRHTFGSRSAMAGVDLPTLKELMGHGSITITMRYVHPTPAHKMQAMQKLQQYNIEKGFETCPESHQKFPQ